jgi:hypothetical protein
MKKLFSTILVLGLLLSGNVFGEIKTLEWEEDTLKERVRADNDIYIICADKHKFLIVRDYNWTHSERSEAMSAISVTQIFERHFDKNFGLKSLPAKC